MISPYLNKSILKPTVNWYTPLKLLKNVLSSEAPEVPTLKWQESWQGVFGEPMPDFRGLYQRAHGVLIKVADKGDPVIDYLFPIADLPQLA